MKPIQRAEILDLPSYEAVRDHFRARVIQEKKRRRVELGPNVSALFENRDTVLLQIQEMLRTERITRPAAIDHEIETYNDFIPLADELSCTVMIQIPNPAERDAFLVEALGFEKHVWLEAGAHRVRAHGKERGDEASNRTTAVHYLKFALPRALADELRALRPGVPPPEVALEVTLPVYSVRAALPQETLLDLGADLSE
jgi:Protein of unknown function (DUF3501)